MKIGVLDIQGSVEEHFAVLKKIGIVSRNSLWKKGGVPENKQVEPVLIKKAEDLKGVKGLIIPGGESTTIGKLLKRFGLKEEIVKRVLSGKLAVWGTCAGAILIAKKIEGKEERINGLGLMDITIERNAYGRQIDSFETEIGFDFGKNGQEYGSIFKKFEKKIKKIPAVFIRAPKILKIGKNVEILAKYKNDIVAVREGNLLATTFHPEMTDDLKVHRYFVEMCL